MTFICPVQHKFKSVALFLTLVLFSITSFAQSSDQNNPSPVTSNEVSGDIAARDIGDSRLTTYYYLFTGNRGDVFINILTSNINGTIDIFTLNGLKPRTKVTLFADNTDSETGRIVYMRESEKLILRIQGRTPNDDPGKFQIKFAGTFAPHAAITGDVDPRVDGDITGSVRVNSVGTIIEDPKPPRTNPAAAKNVDPPVDDTAVAKTQSPGKNTAGSNSDSKNSTTPKPADASAGTVVLVVEEPVKDPEKASVAAKTADSGVTSARPAETTIEITVGINTAAPRRSALVTISRDKPETESETGAVGIKTEPEPGIALTLEEKLAKIQLRISLRDGTTFSKPMNEVLTVNVIKGVLTVVTTEGKILEFSILDVVNMTIQ